MKANRLLLPLLSMPLVLLSTACVADYDQGYAPTYPPGYDSGQGSGEYQQPGDLFGGQDVGSIDVFTEPLTQYGRWVNSRYGRAFQPSAGQDYRPYVNGYWGEDRLWISDDPWGWATDHYGRWGFDEDFGWVWAPGTQWAPSWVAWREDADQDVNGQNIVGWAPIPPGVSYSIGVGFGSGFGYDNYNSWYAPSWVWVPRSYVYQRGFGGRVLPWNSGRNYWSGSRWNYNSGWNGRPGYNRPGGWGPRAGNRRPDGDRNGRPGYGQPGNGRPGYGQPGVRPPGYGQPGYRQPDGNRDGSRDVGRDGDRDGRFNPNQPRQRPDGSGYGAYGGGNGTNTGRPGYRQPGEPGFVPNQGRPPGAFSNNGAGNPPGATDGRRGYYDRQNRQDRQDRRAGDAGLPQVDRRMTPAPVPGTPGYSNQPVPPRNAGRFGDDNRNPGANPGNPPTDPRGDGQRRGNNGFGGNNNRAGDGGNNNAAAGRGGRPAMIAPPVQSFTPPPQPSAPPAQVAPPQQRMQAPPPLPQPRRAEPERRQNDAQRQRAENRSRPFEERQRPE